ncbi:SIR2 family protein [Vibrio profundi]|uniref:SIR2 family protein n=1 Tax=Vibrio profundi TaxID=1774960 RepID=UPI003734D55D
MSNFFVPQSLKDKIEGGCVIPLVGAGVSMAIKDKSGKKVFPSWKELLTSAADKLGEEGKETERQVVLGTIEMNQYGMAATIAKDNLMGSLWYEFLDDHFKVDFSELDPNSANLQKEIWKISNKIITLNYDDCLKWANPAPPNVVTFDNINSVQLRQFKLRNNIDEMIWHLHGNINNPENIILTPNSYERLYNTTENTKSSYDAALVSLREVVSTNSILFIGSSLNDIEFICELEKQNQLFSNNTGPHYAIIKESDKQNVEQRLSHISSNIEIITFEDYGLPLIQLVRSLGKDSKFNNVEQKEKEPTRQDTEKSSKLDIVKIFESNPLDKPKTYDSLYKSFKKLKTTINIEPFNIDNIYEKVDYAFIFTKWSRNGFLMEDDDACSDYTSLIDILDCLPSQLKGLVILVDELPQDIDIDIIESQYDTPVLILPHNNFDTNTLKKLAQIQHKIFKKRDFTFIENTIAINHSNFDTNINLTGKNTLVRTSSNNLFNIDKSSFSNFVGRASDLATVSREISRIEDRNLALVLKGSGGVGKTEVAKKVAIELHARGKFSDGVTFIDCEPISDLDQFKQKLSLAFNKQGSDDLLAELAQSIDNGSRLIILDNYESILNIQNQKNEFLSLIGPITEYATVLITSREVSGESWEEEYTLRSLESDEALVLFNNITKHRYTSESNQKFLKQNILENLLDRNPLAIKLIASSLPPGKSLRELENDLENEFSNCDALNLFSKDIDRNINRQQSLLASIVYSYKTLNTSERKALELISYFPDGINLSTLKTIANKSNELDKLKGSKNIISDKDIKTLSDKSLLNRDCSKIKLHSIINRYILAKANINESNNYYWTEVAKYNMAFFDYLYNIKSKDKKVALDHALSNANNALLAASIGDKIDFSRIEQEEYINYLDTLDYFTTSLSICDSFHKVLVDLLERLKEKKFEENFNLSIDMLLCSSLFFDGNFETSLDYLEDRLPLGVLVNFEAKSFIDHVAKNTAWLIYNMLGHSMECYKFRIEHDEYKRTGYPDYFYERGIILPELLDVCTKNMEYYESKRLIGIDYSDEITESINNLHALEHIERCQLSYLLHKIKPLDNEVITKLTNTNSYTVGIKNLMLVSNLEREVINSGSVDNDTLENIHGKYNSIFSDLYYIKYFLVHAKYQYACFLKSINQTQRFQTIVNKGIELSQKYSYQLFEHEFKRLDNPELGAFSFKQQSSYPYNLDPVPFSKKAIKYISSKK